MSLWAALIPGTVGAIVSACLMYRARTADQRFGAIAAGLATAGILGVVAVMAHIASAS